MSLALKICGVTQAKDLAFCEQAGVDAIGINLWPHSKRNLTLDQAQTLLASHPSPSIMKVGVFVDPTPEELLRASVSLRLDLIQLHGDRPVQGYASLGIPYIWVIRGTPALSELSVPTPLPRWVILDAATPHYGGEGLCTDWNWAKRALSHLSPLPVWLAGGIRPDNLDAAIAQVRPQGVDVASGAEQTGAKRGEKDEQKIKKLLAGCRAHSF